MRRARSEELRIVVPVGSPRSVWTQALAVGLRYASEYIDRPAGLAGAVVYSAGESAFVAYWTRARRVVVYLDEREGP